MKAASIAIVAVDRDARADADAYRDAIRVGHDRR